jgi:hypothetical protein
MKRTRVRLIALLFFLLFFPLVFFAAAPALAQGASNAADDLTGENMGGAIYLWWSEEPAATQYVLYRSTSQNGPWQQLGTIDSDISLTGGPKVDRTADARLMTLCYKLEALDAAGRVVRTYQPMCVPKYAEQQ